MRITVLLIFCAFFRVFAQSPAASKPVLLFTTGKAAVNTSEFIYLYKKNHQQKPEDFTPAKIEEYLNLYVNFKLKVSEALTRGLDTTQSFKKEFDQYRDEIKKPYISEGDDLDRLVKEAYQRSTEQVRASHILIGVKAEATPADTLAAWNKILELRNKAMAGDDFAALAKEFSEDPSAKTNGGDLGYFTAMDMVYPFESAAYNTKVGEVSPIVKTRFGYHIIKVADHRPSNGEVEVSHIMLRPGKDNSTDLRNKIFEINDQLKAGRKWEELCQEFSDDPNTKSNGGRLRQFGMGAFTTSAPEFENTAFALKNPGDFSDPIQTPFGWHIIRLEKKIPVQSFKEAQAALSRKVARDERLQLSKKARLEKIKLQFQFKEESTGKSWAFALADSSLQKGKWNYDAKAAGLSKTMCSVSGTNRPCKEFLEYVRQNQSVNTQSPSTYMAQLYDNWVERILSQAEEEKLIREKPEFKSMVDEYREGILLFTIMETEVWNRASNDSIGQKKYYEANKTKFSAGDRVQARVFSTDDKKILEELKNKIAKGDTLKAADLRKLKSVSNYRAYEKGESKVIDKISWTVGTHETEIDSFFYLIDVSKLIPPGIKSFEEARASVISDYQDQLEKEWITELKKKYPVSMNAKGKKAVMKELAPKKW
jgi:peptidyl-prolyl cis-trans isomerase SurA